MVHAFTPCGDIIRVEPDFDGTPAVWILDADLTVLHGHHTVDPTADLLFWIGTTLN